MALTRETLSSVVCGQQRGRPACASAQSAQRLIFAFWKVSLSYLDLLPAKFEFSSRAGWFESRFVGNLEDRFSRDEAHMLFKKIHSDYHAEFHNRLKCSMLNKISSR